MIVDAWECIGGGPLNGIFVTFPEYVGSPLAIVATDQYEVASYTEYASKALAKRATLYVYRYNDMLQKFVLEV